MAGQGGVYCDNAGDRRSRTMLFRIKRKKVCIALVSFLLLLVSCQKTNWDEIISRTMISYQRGNFEGALRLANRALRLAEKEFGPEDPRVAASYNNIAFIHFSMEKYGRAAKYYKQSVPIYEAAFGPDSEELIKPLRGLAEANFKQKRFAEGESYYNRIIEILKGKDGPDALSVADAQISLADGYVSQGRLPAAERLYGESLRIIEENLDENDLRLAKGLETVAKFYSLIGKKGKSRSLKERAKEIRLRLIQGK